MTHIDPIRVEFLEGTDPALTAGTPLKIAGWGDEGICSVFSVVSRRLKVCCNAVNAFPPPSSQFLFWFDACDPISFCADPVFAKGGPRPGDSGGAALIESSCGEFSLVAVNQTPNSGVVLGPVENLEGFPITAYKSNCGADLNGDDVVNGLDLAVLLANWEGVGSTNGDLDCNGTINGQDLAMLLAAWGACPEPCGGEGAGATGGGEAAGSQQSVDDDAFHQWALQATIDQLFHWLETGCWDGSDQ